MMVDTPLLGEGDRTRASGRWRGFVTRMKRAFGKITLLVVSILTALFMAEGLVRLVAPQQLIIKRPDIWVGSDSLGWKHRANLSTTINTGERTVHVYTDSLGNRVGADREGTGTQHILFLGDSFTEAFQVEYRDSFAGLLERRLSRQLGEGVNIDNTAVGGWAPPHYVREARASLRRRNYDLVAVFLYIGNDVVARRPDSIPKRTPTEVHQFQWPDRFTYSDIVNSWLYPVNDFLEVRSEAFILFKTASQQILRRLGLTAGYFPTILRKRAQSSERWDITAGICSNIADLASEYGSRTVFVIIPSQFQVYERRFREAIAGFDVDPEEVVDLEVPNRRLSEELREKGLRVIDLLPTLQRRAEQGVQVYGSVDAHLSPSGHRIVADRLHAEFVKSLRDVE